MRITSLALLTLMASFAVWGCGNSGTDTTEKSDDKLTIAVIPKGTTHEFWKTVEAGAVKAASELDVEVIWKGPLKEDDRAEQVKVVNDFISKGVDGICLAPLDSKGLRKPVADSVAADIPVVIFDSGIEDSEIVSFVATDNFVGGETAGQHMAELLGEGGKVIVLRYVEGSASTSQREEGFLAAANEAGLEILSDEQYAGATADEARQAADQLIQRFSAGDGIEADGIFCPNESSAVGMLRALQQAGLAGKVKFVGFDSSSKLLDGLNAGEIDALVVQDPFNMGYLTVKSMVAHLKGESVDPRIDTGSTLVTLNNIGEQKVKDLLGL